MVQLVSSMMGEGSDCVEHNQKGNKAGYGNGSWGGQQIMLHRLAYCFYKQIPPEVIKGSVIMHTCDNPRCVNPLHLKLGTQADNMRDMQTKGRSTRGASSYIAKLTQEDVLYVRSVYKPRHPEFSCYALARKFNVTPPTMHNAITGARWGWLQDDDDGAGL